MGMVPVLVRLRFHFVGRLLLVHQLLLVPSRVGGSARSARPRTSLKTLSLYVLGHCYTPIQHEASYHTKD